jgi:hypothetical protein
MERGREAPLGCLVLFRLGKDVTQRAQREERRGHRGTSTEGRAQRAQREEHRGHRVESRKNVPNPDGLGRVFGARVKLKKPIA